MPGVQHVESADGASIAFRSSGSGEPLLLVHGSCTSGVDWVLVARHLRDRFTVVTMDRRGRGASGDGAGYSMEREVEDVSAVLDAVGARLLAGHSFGALCCVRVAERRPDLEALVLYEPPMSVTERHFHGLRELLAAGRADFAVERFLVGAGVPENQVGSMRSAPVWGSLLDAAPTLPRELEAATSWRHPAEPIDVPSLLLLGAETEDPVYLQGVEELEAAFPRMQRRLLPGQRHLAHVLAAAEFADLLAAFCGDARKRVA